MHFKGTALIQFDFIKQDGAGIAQIPSRQVALQDGRIKHTERQVTTGMGRIAFGLAIHLDIGNDTFIRTVTAPQTGHVGGIEQVGQQFSFVQGEGSKENFRILLLLLVVHR